MEGKLRKPVNSLPKCRTPLESLIDISLPKAIDPWIYMRIQGGCDIQGTFCDVVTAHCRSKLKTAMCLIVCDLFCSPLMIKAFKKMFIVLTNLPSIAHSQKVLTGRAAYLRERGPHFEYSSKNLYLPKHLASSFLHYSLGGWLKPLTRYLLSYVGCVISYSYTLDHITFSKNVCSVHDVASSIQLPLHTTQSHLQHSLPYQR